MIELSHLSASVMVLSVLIDRNQIFQPSLQRFRHVSREIMQLYNQTSCDMVTSPDKANQFRIYWQVTNKQRRHLVRIGTHCRDPQQGNRLLKLINMFVLRGFQAEATIMYLTYCIFSQERLKSTKLINILPHNDKKLL